METNKIYNCDNLEFLKRIPDNYFDFVFSDPPYNKNKNYEIYKDNLPEKEYWKWVEKFISEYKRISNNQFAIFIGADLTRNYWSFMPDAKQIIVRKGAIGTPFKDYYRQYFSLLVTKKPNQTIYDLWWNIKMPGEGYFFKEKRFPNPGLTSFKLTHEF
jgi:DNA modification methylase